MNWQPITKCDLETESGRVLVWCPDYGYACVGYFDRGIWQDVGGFEINPTHWCEIVPPQEPQSDAK